MNPLTFIHERVPVRLVDSVTEAFKGQRNGTPRQALVAALRQVAHNTRSRARSKLMDARDHRQFADSESDARRLFDDARLLDELANEAAAEAA